MLGLKAAKAVFGAGRNTPELTYLGAPIVTDFELTYENLIPYTAEVLRQSAPIEGCGEYVSRVEIKNGIVKVE
jgi:hypothetical protein